MRWFIFILLLLTAPVKADVVVLIHGFLESAQDWYKHGVVAALSQQGWAPNRKGHQVITLNLPYAAPIMGQVNVLSGFLKDIQHKHPEEKLILVGHSAGGVVARALVVYRPDIHVDCLITLAAPHNGTDWATGAYALSRTPMKDIAKAMGAGVLAHAKYLYRDLQPPKPGNFLYQLNTRKHPDITYISIVRPYSLWNDFVVPETSQNMNYVPGIQGRSFVYFTDEGHGLSYQDGFLIGRILNEHCQTPGT